MENLFGFIIAGVALTGSPGPATLSIAAAGAAFGARRSFGYMAGVIVGVTMVMGITASGVIGVVLAFPGAAPAVVVAASAYMLYLAYRIATAPPLAEQGEQDRPPSFYGGVFLALVNPKAYAAMAALFSGFVLVLESPLADALTKGAILLVIITSVNLVWIHVGAALTRLFREPRANRTINISFAVLLIVSVWFALRL